MRRWWVSKHVGSSKLSIYCALHGTILFACPKGLLRKMVSAYAFLKIDVRASKSSSFERKWVKDDEYMYNKVTRGHQRSPRGHERSKIVKLKVENGQKVFTACRRRLEVCGREISMSRLLIHQLRWEAVDWHDLTPPTQFIKVLNFHF